MLYFGREVILINPTKSFSYSYSFLTSISALKRRGAELNSFQMIRVRGFCMQSKPITQPTFSSCRDGVK
jgi:hypothetical protein